MAKFFLNFAKAICQKGTFSTCIHAKQGEALLGAALIFFALNGGLEKIL